jgi:LuxR family maltose regulon positive regulatory protein
VAERWADHGAARVEATVAVELSSRFPVAFPWLAAQAALVLGQVQLRLGDRDGAGRRIEDARRQLVRLPAEGVLRAQLEALAAAWARAGTDVQPDGVPALSRAEVTVLGLLGTHLRLGEIADELHVSRNTVKSQVASLYRKLDASSRSEALRRARQLGLG